MKNDDLKGFRGYLNSFYKLYKTRQCSISMNRKKMDVFFAVASSDA
jgi:hypothetical protein